MDLSFLLLVRKIFSTPPWDKFVGKIFFLPKKESLKLYQN
jgi:hypothetical protein